MNDETRSERMTAKMLLERCKRGSLRRQVWRAAHDMGALLRCTAVEAPEVQQRLRTAVEALQMLGARLALEDQDPATPEFEAVDRPGPSAAVERD